MLGRVRSVLGWARSQVTGTYDNVRSALARVRPDDLLPPTILSTLRWLKIQVPRAAGFGTPLEQISASIVIAAVLILSSLGAATPLAIALVPTFAIGVYRLIPVIGDYWPLSDGSSYQ